ncbi:hypothetical protein [Peribacillus simplex]|uniref:hypothetical protein n=1 Tax=Peribacillus simplex TaxID=1478 RepID=UPI000BA7D44B|nr:hypothetical protein [Peribacillus simplex]PAK38147.1 hypothetical protein CHI08_21445 [Peribacillus simplex]
MSKNNQLQKQLDTQLSVANFTGTELGQELANIHQEVSQLIRISISKFPTRWPSKSSFKLIKKTDSII